MPNIPASCEHVKCLVQIKIKVTMKMSSDKLMYLVFTLGMEVLELVQISSDIETIGCEHIWLSLDQVFTLHSRDLAGTKHH